MGSIRLMGHKIPYLHSRLSLDSDAFRDDEGYGIFVPRKCLIPSKFNTSREYFQWVDDLYSAPRSRHTEFVPVRPRESFIVPLYCKFLSEMYLATKYAPHHCQYLLVAYFALHGSSHDYTDDVELEFITVASAHGDQYWGSYLCDPIAQGEEIPNVYEEQTKFLSAEWLSLKADELGVTLTMISEYLSNHIRQHIQNHPDLEPDGVSACDIDNDLRYRHLCFDTSYACYEPAITTFDAQFCLKHKMWQPTPLGPQPNMEGFVFTSR